MTTSATRTSAAAPAIPRPRSPRPTVAATPQEQPGVAEPGGPEPRAAEFPWPEPWRHAQGARRRSEYWDVATAGWHSRAPYPDRSSAD